MRFSAVQVKEGEQFLLDGRTLLPADAPGAAAFDRRAARRGTIACRILAAHNAGGRAEPGGALSLRFDALASHDITFVGIIQTAIVSGLTSFPVPYILTNCHNSLCAVGGTINEDDHVFGLSAAKKYGGVYVPPHLGVIHSYMREAWAACGAMILGSDSHTRYGALGTLAVGEGGGELVKQLLGQRYSMAFPRVIAVYLEGAPAPGVGPQDVALSLIGAVYASGFAKNAVLEFTGPGVAALSADFRCGIDVMTTETACWSSVWETDGVIRAWLSLHGREEAYRELRPASAALYDGAVTIDLGAVRPMIALPFHPSNVYELDAVLAAPRDVFSQVQKDAEAVFGKPVDLGLMDKVDGGGAVHVDQGIVAGCSGGTFENICAVSRILGDGGGGGADAPFSLSVYPGSQAIFLELARNGTAAGLAAAGAVIRTACCGPCFGAGDVPANKGLSIRHTTRNFPNREGSKPGQGQIASTALMDARSIAATARSGGVLASAFGMETGVLPPYRFDGAPYRARVYNGAGKPGAGELVYGPNITGWPPMEAPGENLLLKIVSFITDPVTTTDELIPSGETSSYRSNPIALAEFTLSRKDPAYVGRAKALREEAAAIREGRPEEAPELAAALAAAAAGGGGGAGGAIQAASAIFAVKPGDGSAREQAASCQRVLGGAANFASEYATKRYRSNLVNWGIIPFIVAGTPPFGNGDYVYVPRARDMIAGTVPAVEAAVLRVENGAARRVTAFTLAAPELDKAEREILLAGSLINYNRALAGGRGGEGT
jgi:aconitate hydratase